MQIDAIQQILGQMAEINPTSPIHNSASGVSFSSLLSDGVHQVNDKLQAADQLLTDYALGKKVSTHELMITMQQAKISMQLAVEVRNKLVEGYQELMRMSV